MEYWSNGVVAGGIIFFISHPPFPPPPPLPHSIAPPLPRSPSSNTNAALALFEKGAQLRQIVFAGLQSDRVDIVPAQYARKLMLAIIHNPVKTRSRTAISCVDFNLIAGLGVFQGDDADIWQYP